MTNDTTAEVKMSKNRLLLDSHQLQSAWKMAQMRVFTINEIRKVAGFEPLQDGNLLIGEKGRGE